MTDWGPAHQRSRSGDSKKWLGGVGVLAALASPLVFHLLLLTALPCGGLRLYRCARRSPRLARIWRVLVGESATAASHRLRVSPPAVYLGAGENGRPCWSRQGRGAIVSTHRSRWSPLACSRDWDGALLMARAMFDGAAVAEEPMRTVAGWVTSHDIDGPLGRLGDHADAGAEDQNFGAGEFVASGDAVYIQAPAESQRLAAPLVGGLLAEIRRATSRAHASGELAGRRVLFALDEVANVAPIAELPQITSEGGCQGLLLLAVLQDLSQAGARWAAIADGFLTLFGTKLVLPGVADQRTRVLSPGRSRTSPQAARCVSMACAGSWSHSRPSAPLTAPSRRSFMAGERWDAWGRFGASTSCAYSMALWGRGLGRLESHPAQASFGQARAGNTRAEAVTEARAC